MKYKALIYKTAVALAIIGSLHLPTKADELQREQADILSIRDEVPLPTRNRFIHRIGTDFRTEYVLPNNDFLRGANTAQSAIRHALSAHLRYTFQVRPESPTGRIYKGVYQGIGAAYYHLGNLHELGNPTVVYLFQGARIAQLSPRFSLNYEWNLGLSFGWKPYDPNNNPNNTMTGGRVNVYINADIYFDWMLSRRWSVQAGLAATHFSNGNTQLPNVGLNSLGMRVGLACNLGQTLSELPSTSRYEREFPRHMSYDLTLFGSWRSTAVEQGGRTYLSPSNYPVAGLNFAAMYNYGYKFRAGLSLDGVYNASANVYIEDRICDMAGDCPDPVFLRPSFAEQLALGVSVRGEFVMPYFSIGLGLGFNIVRKGETRLFYQMLTLKTDLTRNSYLHIGFCLQDYLMLGVGYRFNNKRPRVR